jgi:signal transduction histidine kinase
MGQLQQVFTNLFVNAADAMEGKGELSISATYDHDRSLFLFSVKDTGPGIPEDQLQKIFDMFYTTKPAGRGTGLGLSISQNIVKLHGGQIYVECPPEGGTVFTIELPCEFTEACGEQPVFVGMDG